MQNTLKHYKFSPYLSAIQLNLTRYRGTLLRDKFIRQLISSSSYTAKIRRFGHSIFQLLLVGNRSKLSGQLNGSKKYTYFCICSCGWSINFIDRFPDVPVTYLVSTTNQCLTFLILCVFIL